MLSPVVFVLYMDGLVFFVSFKNGWLVKTTKTLLTGICEVYADDFSITFHAKT